MPQTENERNAHNWTREKDAEMSTFGAKADVI